MTCPFPGVAIKFCGALGVPIGVTAFDGAEAGPVPTALVAVTVNVYEAPLVSPVTVIGLPAPLALMLPGLDVTVYPDIGLPPLFGAVKLIVALPLPCVANTFVGAPGAVAGPDCLILIVRLMLPASDQILNEAVLDDVDLFSSTLIVSVPSPVPRSGDTVIHE